MKTIWRQPGFQPESQLFPVFYSFCVLSPFIILFFSFHVERRKGAFASTFLFAHTSAIIPFHRQTQFHFFHYKIGGSTFANRRRRFVVRTKRTEVERVRRKGDPVDLFCRLGCFPPIAYATNERTTARSR